jgi:hypothetical protein
VCRCLCLCRCVSLSVCVLSVCHTHICVFVCVYLHVLMCVCVCVCVCVSVTVLVIASDPTSANLMTQKAILVSNAVQKTLRQSGLTSLSVSASGSVIVDTKANSSIISPGGGTGARAFTYWSLCKCKVNSDCAFVQNLTLFCMCMRHVYKMEQTDKEPIWGS